MDYLFLLATNYLAPVKGGEGGQGRRQDLHRDRAPQEAEGRGHGDCEEGGASARGGQSSVPRRPVSDPR